MSKDVKIIIFMFYDSTALFKQRVAKNPSPSLSQPHVLASELESIKKAVFLSMFQCTLRSTV